ncbi:hypothetical protein F4678DRAFT_416827 [Xylaria arbuscula]|nr:hypothetical protein F4678DRAFT_416827 [Xylaria arbuscula]
MTLTVRAKAAPIASRQASRPWELKKDKKSHFARSLEKNLEAQKQKSSASREAFRSQSLRDRRCVAPKTQKERDRLTDAWDLYFSQVCGIDPDSVWIDICNGKDHSDSIRDFLMTYVRHSDREQPCLGPSEYTTVRRLKSAVSIEGFWKTLCRAADTGVLQRKRLEDPANEFRWTISRQIAGHGHAYNTITKINLWIEQELPDLLGLSRKQSFEKKEMTPDDVMVLLSTLWAQARHIPCTPQIRIAFHTAVLIAAIGGFRPGVLMALKYKHVQFELLQDPKDPSQRRLVASIEIEHNKQETKSIQHSQHRTLSICVTTIPCKPLCLVSLLVGRALADRAFEEDFQSLDDVLNRPNLDGTESLPLRWAKGVEDKPIIPLTYASYKEVWSRTLTVAGLRDRSQRPYSLRVGAGGRLSGSVTEPVRNYVLGNTDDVFLKSYQPHRVSQNLVQIAFGDRAGGDNADVFASLRRSFLQRDPYAPIYVSPEDLSAIEERQDVRELRGQYREVVAQSSSDSPDAKAVAAKIHWIKCKLSEERLVELRNTYFEEVDRLRATGAAPPRPPDHSLNPRKSFDPQGAAAAESIGEFMQLEQDGSGDSSLDLVGLYIPLLRRCPADVATLLDRYRSTGQDAKAPLSPQPAVDPKRPHRCLFGCDSFRRRGHLTDHNTNVHFNRGDFDQPFLCPECRRLGLGNRLIEGPMQWSNHVETYHGREHAPNLPTGLNSRPDASWMKTATHYQRAVGQEGRCLVCCDIFKNAGAFATHFRTQHVVKQKLFESPFDCPECVRQQTKPSRFDSATGWQAHIKDCHQGGGLWGEFHTVSPSRRKKRARAEVFEAHTQNRPSAEPCPKKLKLEEDRNDSQNSLTDVAVSSACDLSFIDPKLVEDCERERNSCT